MSIINDHFNKAFLLRKIVNKTRKNVYDKINFTEEIMTKKDKFEDL